jgi:hypothetical protein
VIDHLHEAPADLLRLLVAHRAQRPIDEQRGQPVHRRPGQELRASPPSERQHPRLYEPVQGGGQKLEGFLLLLVLTSLWAVVFAGFMQLIALKTRSAAATNSGGLVFFPLLFLTPNFVPRQLLTRPMEIAATFNPVTYVMEELRSLILQDFAWAPLARGFGVVAVLGVVMVALNVRLIRDYD